ncbi:MAG TPA: hypothetical protein VFQ58_09500 [Flavisolibacter sp.]|jgi:hypothetical protein|nr:hypothetical protein [Flavisolibacter sp.]
MKENTNSRPSDENITGRVDKPGDQYKEQQNKADISHVDRQEGTMNHGTKGGNFNDNDPEEGKEKVS